MGGNLCHRLHFHLSRLPNPTTTPGDGWAVFSLDLAWGTGWGGVEGWGVRPCPPGLATLWMPGPHYRLPGVCLLPVQRAGSNNGALVPTGFGAAEVPLKKQALNKPGSRPSPALRVSAAQAGARSFLSLQDLMTRPYFVFRTGTEGDSEVSLGIWDRLTGLFAGVHKVGCSSHVFYSHAPVRGFQQGQQTHLPCFRHPEPGQGRAG